MPAFSFGPSINAHLKNVRIVGADVGIAASPGAVLTARDIHFENVRQPFDLHGVEADVSGTRIRQDPKIREKREGGNKSQVGWSRIGGPAMPAQCPRCSSVFPSVNYRVRESRFWSRDNQEVCPICGYEHAKVADGLYDLTAETVQAIAQIALSKSPVVLSKIREASIDVVENRIDPIKYIRIVRGQSRKLPNVLRKANKIGKTAVELVILVAAIASAYYTMDSYRLQSNDRSQEILEAIYVKLNELVIIEKAERTTNGEGTNSTENGGHDANRTTRIEPGANGSKKSGRIKRRPE